MKVQAYTMNVILYSLLKGIPLSGDIYHFRRPAKSELEDIVLNNLGLPGTDTEQNGTANVNIYVPDIPFKEKGQNDLFPDNQRLQELTQLVINRLEYVQSMADENEWGVQYELDFSADGGLEEVPESECHFQNIRVDFRFFT